MTIPKEELKKQTLFEGLTDDELEIVGENLTELKFKKGDSIFREEAPTSGIFLLKSGKVEIKRRLQLDTKTKMLIMIRNLSSNEVRHSVNGWEHVFANISAGEFFGELSIIENRKNTALKVSQLKIANYISFLQKHLRI
ncbi:Crp/Fnr family transcriptional regulator [Candidatus Magnetoovum chiemensis]|nr:Crp/Fnr family transcriptional regulator [Candidatus Magnetoovum chiemensis]